jgi:cell fate regulator YaaT (PSP1 superfamily)
MGISDTIPFDVVEVSFKNGSRKDFFKNPPFTRTTTGDFVLVESASGGYDLGKISLSGELVRMQMKRKRIKNDARLGAVIRKAHERDVERLDELRKEEKGVMVKARTIARTLDLQMKVCDIEFQGDGRKCTFFYTAEGRVDFRELIRHYAKEFKVKIEMRQIGARQESARIGGLGNCGRELCCSTWLSEFKSVNTAAARYQNLAINQTKLSGMCGRLKCCLNYELDTYIDALEDFPDKADKLKTKAGLAVLMKTDVFKRLMFYAYIDNKIKFYALHVDQVWDAMDMIKNGNIPNSLDDILAMAPPSGIEEVEEYEPDFENVDNVIQLPLEKRKKKKKKKKNDRGDTAAAAVERAEQADQQRAGKGTPQQQRRDNRPHNKSGGGDRPPRPEGDNRPPRTEGDNRNPNKPGGGDRPPRPEGNNRPPRPEGDNRNPNKPSGGDRPPRPEGNNRPPRTEGDNKNPNKPGGGDRPPRPEGNNRPPRTEGDNKNPNKPGGGDRPPRPEGNNRPPRPEGDNKNPNKPGGGDRPPRPEGNNRPPRTEGDNKNPNKPGGGDRPPRPEGNNRPPRPEGDNKNPNKPSGG